MREYYYEDFEQGVTHTSPAISVSEADIIEFARKYDPQYFHVDPEAAKKSAFGELVASGMQTAALSWTLVLQSRMFDQAPMAGLGMDELRWIAPVRPGDTLRCRFTLVEGRLSRSQADRAIGTFRYEMINQRDETVMTLKITQTLRRRPGA